MEIEMLNQTIHIEDILDDHNSDANIDLSEITSTDAFRLTKIAERICKSQMNNLRVHVHP